MLDAFFNRSISFYAENGTTVELGIAALAAMIGCAALILQRELLRREDWVNYFGCAYVVLALQNFVLGLQGLNEFQRWHPLITITLFVNSAASNLLIVAAGRALLQRRSRLPPVSVGLAVMTIMPALWLIILERPEREVRYQRDIMWAQLPDTLFSAYCLVTVGWTMYYAIRSPSRSPVGWSRIYREIGVLVFGFLSLLSTIGYVVSLFTYSMGLHFITLIDDHPIVAIEGTAVVIAFALKLPLAIGALLVVTHSLTMFSTAALRRTLRQVTQGQAEYLSNEGILRALGQSVNADVVELCVRMPNPRLSKVVWIRWVSDPASQAAGERTPSGYQRCDYPVDQPSIINALESGIISSSSVLFRKGNAPSYIVTPIFYHGAVIGCLKLEWSSKLIITETMAQRLYLISDQLAPSVEALRRIAALQQLGEWFSRLEICQPDLLETEFASNLLRVVHETLSPVASAILLEIGFRGIWAVRTDQENSEGLMDQEVQSLRELKEFQHLFVSESAVTKTTDLEVNGVRIGRLIVTVRDCHEISA